MRAEAQAMAQAASRAAGLAEEHFNSQARPRTGDAALVAMSQVCSARDPCARHAPEPALTGLPSRCALRGLCVPPRPPPNARTPRLHPSAACTSQQLDWTSDLVMHHATAAGGGLQLDDDLSQFISALTGTGSCSPDAAATGAGAAPAAAHPRLRDSPPSVGAQPRLSFPTAEALEAMHAAAPPPRAATDRGRGAAAPQRLRRSHTFNGALTLPPPAPASARSQPGSARKKRPAEDEAAPDGSFMAMLTEGLCEAAPAAGATQPPTGVRRTASMPSVGARASAAQRIGAMLGSGSATTATANVAPPLPDPNAPGFILAGGNGSSASYGIIPEWARERDSSSPPQLTAAGVPLFSLPVAPPPGAPATSAFRGVSRAPWSTRWDVHVPRPGAPPGAPLLFLGSFDAEERAARAHDLAMLKMHGGASPATVESECNFSVAEFPGLDELAMVPDGDFVDALVASAYEPSERRYSAYRGVFRPRGAPKSSTQFEGRLEEAPASVLHAQPASFSSL